MTRAEFWELIRATRRRDPQEHAGRLTAKLAGLTVKEILAFGKWWYRLRDAAYSWPLWGAAYIMNGGCSDDGFTDFRTWLILQGQAVYEAALKDPDSLSKCRVESAEAECECYPASEAYERATGTEDADAFFDALEAKHGPIKPLRELGERWDFEDDAEMRNRYPKLARKFFDAD